MEEREKEKMNQEKYNASGAYDPVTFAALEKVSMEEEARKWPVVYICSPLAGDVKRNLANAKRYSRFASMNGAVVFTPHFYAEYLDDYLPDYDRLQIRYKGRQSADQVMRCQKFGDDHKQIALDNRIFDYMYEDKVREVMQADIAADNVADIVRIDALNTFLREYA